MIRGLDPQHGRVDIQLPLVEKDILPAEGAELAETDAGIEAEHDSDEVIVQIHILMKVILDHFLLISAEYTDGPALVFDENPVQVRHRNTPVVPGILHNGFKNRYNAPCGIAGQSFTVIAV